MICSEGVSSSEPPHLGDAAAASGPEVCLPPAGGQARAGEVAAETAVGANSRGGGVVPGAAAAQVLLPQVCLALVVRGADSGLSEAEVACWVRDECGFGAQVGSGGACLVQEPGSSWWQQMQDRFLGGMLTVVDATVLAQQVRASVVAMAAEHGVQAVGVVLGADQGAVGVLSAAGCEDVVEVKGCGGVAAGSPWLDQCRVLLQPLPCDAMDDYGPFDIIGDVHGCAAELGDLLAQLGYRIVVDDAGQAVDAVPPTGRRVIFVGDVVNRGPDSVGALRLAMGMCRSGHALAVQGNHEHQLSMALRGEKVKMRAGLGKTLAEFAAQPQEFRDDAVAWCAGLPSHLVLAGGALVVVHAGLAERFHRRHSRRVTALALYGEPIREKDEHGLPVRRLWANGYYGEAAVVYGHTPTSQAQWLRGTMCLDTGCVYGGALTALRFPEREVVSVPSRGEWFTLLRPLEPLSDLLVGPADEH